MRGVHVFVVRVVLDALWSEGTAHAKFGVVRLAQKNGGEEVGGERSFVSWAFGCVDATFLVVLA